MRPKIKGSRSTLTSLTYSLPLSNASLPPSNLTYIIYSTKYIKTRFPTKSNANLWTSIYSACIKMHRTIQNYVHLASLPPSARLLPATLHKASKQNLHSTSYPTTMPLVSLTVHPLSSKPCNKQLNNLSRLHNASIKSLHKQPSSLT